MAHVMAIVMNKGGVGKSVTAVSLAVIAAQHGRRTLIIDTDHQGNAALSFGQNADLLAVTLLDVLRGTVDPVAAVVPLQDHLSLLPAGDDLALWDFEVLQDREAYPQPFMLLRDRVVRPLLEAYDLIVLDTPPSMGLATGNALVASQSALIPVQAEHFALRGLLKILQAVADIQQRHNSGLTVQGILPTMVDSRTVLTSDVVQEIRRYAASQQIRVFETVIPRSIRFAASPAYHQLPAVLTDAQNPLVAAYFRLYEEVFAP